MIGYHDPKMLNLLLGSSSVNIDGDVCVDVPGPDELVKWVKVLSNPCAFAWRSEVTGERRLQLSGSSEHDPVHGRVTVLLDGDRYRDLWDAVQESDLRCGDEEPVDIDRLRQAAQTPRDRHQQVVPAA